MRAKFIFWKRTLQAVLLVLLLSVVGLTNAQAQSFTVGSLNYSVNDDGTSVTLTGHVDGQSATGTLTIPESVTYGGNNYAVTAIGQYAFTWCSGLTGELVIPNTVTAIGNEAFVGCSGFTGELVLPNFLTTINYGVFVYCSGFTSLIIPNSMTSIGANAFRECNGFLSELIIPNSVTYIGGSAFQGCSGFTALTLSNALTTIESQVFDGCSGFTGSLDIPNSVVTIGEVAFGGCSGFTGELIIPNSVTSIGTYAFQNCSGFSGTLTIPNSVTYLGMLAFGGCSGFTGELVIHEGMLEMSNNVFDGCTGITEVHYNATNCVCSSYGTFAGCSGSLVIGDNVTIIPSHAFKYAGFSGTLTLPSSLTEIGEWAFDGCSGFTGDLTLPNSVTAIGDGAFHGCSGFIGVLNIGESVATIGGQAFSQCSGITEVHYNATNCADASYYVFDYSGETLVIGDNVERIPAYMFGGAMFAGELVIPSSVTSIGNYAFSECSGFTGELIIPTSVTEMGNNVFYNCSGFTGALNIPEAWTEIKEGTFYGCSGFTGTLDIPTSVTSIGASAFQFCSGFTGTLDIPASVTSIGAYAFNYCTGFTGTLVIPENVTEMGEQVFGYCSGITEVHYNATNCSDPTWSPFRYCGGTLVIGNNVERIPHVMFNDAYFTGSLVIPNSVTSIGSYAFWNCNGFTGTLTIPNSVTEIGEDAFNNCSGFTGALVIPNSVTNISWRTFTDCSGFDGGLVIPNSVTEIGGNAFDNCSGFIGDLILPDSLTYIGESAFKNCSGFTGDLIIPNTVTSLNQSAFENCSGFNGSLVLNNTMDYISGYVFKNCSGFTGDLVIPASVIGIGPGAFENTGFDGNLVFLNPETLIGSYAFKGCSGFTGELALPTSLNSVDYEAFRDCSGFTSLTMSLTWISDHAFDGCTGLTQIHSNSEEPPYLNWGVFDNVDKTIPVYVPCGSQQAYQAASGWEEFTNYEGSPGELYVDVNSAILGTATVLQYGICEALESTVHAEPYPGCVFINWTVNGEEVSTDAEYTFDHTNGDITLVANFELGENNYIFMGGGETELWSNTENWMPVGVPTATSIVCIRGNVDINEDVCVAGVYLYDDNVLIVRSGTVLTVTGTLSSPSTSSIIIEDGAQVFHSNEGAMATVQKTVAPYTEDENDGWYLIASPMAFNAYIHDVPNLLNGNYDLYYYDEPTHYWMNMRSGIFEMSFIDRGKGYLYANDQQVTFSFLGEIENGAAEINVPLSYTENIQLSGFNLVGNPFMHNVVSYASENVIEGCFRMNDNRDDFMVSEISEACPLQPTEGFFVKAIAEDASITFNPGRGTTVDRKGSIRVEVLNGGKLIDRLIVKNNGQPLEKLSLKENNTRLFATLDGQEMAIVPVNGNEQTVNFKAAKNGTYTLTVNTDNMDVDYLHLIDNLTGNDIDLLATSTDSASYTFEAKTTDYASRFRLVFSMSGDADDHTEEPFAFFNGSEWVINSTGTATLQVVDMMGRILVSTDVARNVSTSGMAPGMYVLRLVNGENVKTQKIVVR